MKDFFSRLSYSFGNEDWNTEYQALKVTPNDKVVCITASGDRPLNLLLKDCAQVISVDANKIQNYLLKLKGAALKELDHEEYLDFLFARKGSISDQTLERILKWLDPECKSYWQKRVAKLHKGIVYQGAVEVATRKICFLIKLFRGDKIEKLFSMNDLEEQKKFVEKEWDTFAWKKVFKWSLNPLLAKWLLKDPGLYFNIGQHVNHPGLYIYNRMHSYLTKNLAKKSLLLSLLLDGKVAQEAYPPYLIKNSSDVIKDRLDRLHIETKDIISYLEQSEDNYFDCYSLSDVASYIDSGQFERLLKAVLRTAKNGARFSIRQFLSDQQIPKDLSKHFVRDANLEEKLGMEDNCCVYRFIVGEISK
jgi:S-adenosylmethionine-diacylglycerol 3-amino-3-carboxypropyl transferase